MKKHSAADKPKQQLMDLCQQLEEHIKLARDYATTPGNIWLARSELNTIGRLVADLESKLEAIEAASTD